MMDFFARLGANLLGTLAIVAIAGVAAAYYYTNMRVLRVGRGRVALYLGMFAGVALSVATFIVGSQDTLWGIGCAGLALVATVPLLYIDLIYSRVGEQQARTVAVGDHVVDFTALTSTGDAFSLSSFAGRPFLLKFYRGWW